MSKNIIIAIFLMMNIGLLYVVKQKNQAGQKLKQLLTTQNAQQANASKTSNSFIATKYWWEMNSHGSVLPDVSLMSDLSENQETFSLSELIGDSPKLVFRYSEIHCDVCVDSTLNRIKVFAEEIGKKNILLIASYANPRDMYTFKRLNQIDMPLYNLGQQSLGMAAERADTPYLFMINPDRKVERVYLFYKEIAGHIAGYFRILRDNYFNV